jgi:hypothetical protein
MPADELNLRAIEDRVIALVRCVFARAASDKEFEGQLKEILLSEDLPALLRSKKRSNSKREVFDPVVFLSRNGPDELRRELAHMPMSDLADVARKHRCMKTKAIKLAAREELVASTLSYAEREINQGSVFLRSQPRDKSSGDEAAVLDKASLGGTVQVKVPETKKTSD